MLLASAGSAAPPMPAPSATPTSSPTSSPTADSQPRVFFSPLGVGAGADAAVVALVEERLLASARRHPAFDVVAARDVKSLFDVEASRQAAGCDGGIDCAAELAGALDAPQLVSGQLGRVGSTWILSLTRLERVQLTVLARVHREARGDTPEDLLRQLDGAVDELFGASAAATVDAGGGSPLPVVGGIVAGVGVVGLGVGVAGNVVAQRTFDEAKNDLEDPETDNRDQLRARAQSTGDLQNAIALGAYAVGAVVLVVGVVLVVVGAVGGE